MLLDLAAYPNINAIVMVVEHAGIPRATTCAVLHAIGFEAEQLHQLDRLLERPLPATFEEIRKSLADLEPDLSATELDALSYESLNKAWADYELRHTPDLTHIPAGIVDPRAVVPAIEDMCATYAAGERGVYNDAVAKCLAAAQALLAAQRSWEVAKERLDAQDPVRGARRGRALTHFAATMNTMRNRELVGIVNAVVRKPYGAAEADRVDEEHVAAVLDEMGEFDE